MKEFKLKQEDAITYLKSLPDESCNLIVTDPAYESLEKYRAIGTTTRLKDSWFEIFPNDRFEELFKESYRVLKSNSHFYLFCDQETMFAIKPIADKLNLFKFWKPLVWDKEKIGMGYHYRNKYEFIMFFEKGKRKLNNLSISDIIKVPRVNPGKGENKSYPTEKPVEVSDILIKQSLDLTKTDNWVVDPFCGSGSVGEAAILNNCNFHGNDLSKIAVDLTEKRLLVVGGIKNKNTKSVHMCKM